MALQSSTECNSYSLFSDILVFLYVFVIVYLNYEFHDICVFGNLRPLFSPRWGGGLPNAQWAVWQFDDPVVFWL